MTALMFFVLVTTFVVFTNTITLIIAATVVRRLHRRVAELEAQEISRAFHDGRPLLHRLLKTLD